MQINRPLSNQMDSTEVASWRNLWDKTDVVSSHTQRGIDFLDRFSNFIKERAAIEEEYAMKIRNLVKKKRKEEKDERRKEERRKEDEKRTEEEECRVYSYTGAFFSILSELDSLAAQHEIVGEKLKREICPSIADKAQMLRMNRKKQFQHLQGLNVTLQDCIENMLKHQKNYAKAFRDAQTAHIKHEKADKNYDLSRLELDKAKNNVLIKNQISEQAKQAYANGLEIANHAQHDFYNNKLLVLLEDMRKLDMDRIDFTRHTMLESVNAEKSVFNIVQRCYSDMETAISAINPEKDTMVVVKLNQTGYSYPKDFVFEDLGSPANVLMHNGDHMTDSATLKRNPSGQVMDSTNLGKNLNGKGIPRKHSMHQRLFGGSLSNSKIGNQGSADGYGNLPPQQRCRKIESKLKELDAQFATKQQSRAGLEKMLVVYQDPKMGNAADVELQMRQNSKEMGQLVEDIERYKRLLFEAQSELNTPLGSGNFADTASLRTPSYNASPSSSPRVPSGNGSMGGLPSTQLPTGPQHNNNGGAVGKRSSYSEESVSSEGSSTALNHGALGVGLNRTSTNGYYPKPETTKPILSRQHGILPQPPQQQHNTSIQHIDSGSNVDFYEECETPTATQQHKEQKHSVNASSVTAAEDSPVLGTCTALYPFEGNSDGTTIAMKEGDEMVLLERDEGDGWTRVRNVQTQVDGFVPTSYLRCRWYPVVQ